MNPKLLILDEPTEGIQPSIIKDIGHAIHVVAQRQRFESSTTYSWNAANSSCAAWAETWTRTAYGKH